MRDKGRARATRCIRRVANVARTTFTFAFTRAATRGGTITSIMSQADVAALQAEVAASSATLVQIMSMDEVALGSALSAAGLSNVGSKADMTNRLRSHVLERMDLLMSQLPAEAFESNPYAEAEPSAPASNTRGKRQR